jgi:hypothetical protein
MHGQAVGEVGTREGGADHAESGAAGGALLRRGRRTCPLVDRHEGLRAAVDPGGEALVVHQVARVELVVRDASRLILSFLTKAARLGWELPTSQVQLLLGAKPRGASLDRYGFTFRAVGKHGQETSWRVERR